jgi:hypothetical protein
MFDFFTNLWQTVRAFLMGILETVTSFAVENPFMAVVIAIYVAGIVIALFVFLPKDHA